MDPAGLRCEDGKGLAGPETHALVPGANVGNVFPCVLVKVCQIEFPGHVLNVQVLDKNTAPFSAGNSFFESSHCLGSVHIVQFKASCELNVAGQLLPSFVVLVVEGTTLKLNNTGKSV